MLNNEMQKFLNDLLHPIPSVCLEHQLPESSTSPVGLVCECCKLALYTNMPSDRPMIYWESQPVAYTLDRQPLFPLTIRWQDRVIRSLHPNPDHISHRYLPAHVYDDDLYDGLD